MHHSQKVSIYGLNSNQINELKNIALARYGKANISLLVRELVKAELNRQPETRTEPVYQENNFEKQRLTLRLLPKHHAYIAQKAELQHDSKNEIVRDIIAEYITKKPVLSNDAVQALYQSNYQLLRIGRNINQLARQFNAILPQSLTTQQLNDIADFLDKHTDKVVKVLRTRDKPFRFRESRRLIDETTETAN